jgi:hypothetical protein
VLSHFRRRVRRRWSNGSIASRALVYAGLVPNEQGYHRLADAGLEERPLTLGSTETLNKRNANQTIDALSGHVRGQTPDMSLADDLARNHAPAA